MAAARLASVEVVVAACRLADVLSAVEIHGRPLPLNRRDRALPDRLRIVYLVAGAGVGEGEQLLFTQARQLAALGADVTVLYRAHPDDPEVPVEARRAGTRAAVRRVPYGEPIADAVPHCDLIVAGSWELVLPARMLGFAPVVLFERGALADLGEVPEHIRAVVAASLRAAAVNFALGAEARAALWRGYAVEAREVPGVVDLGRFSPSRRPAPPAERPGGLVFVGSRSLEADRFGDAERVVELVARFRPRLRTIWLGPRRPPAAGRFELVESPGEEDRARHLRSAQVFVSTAEHASFALGPLEAMASGTPVVATAHLGILPYARHGVNALLVPVGDVEGIAQAVRRVLEDPALAARLVAGGLGTARAHSWSRVGPELLTSYGDVVRTTPVAPPLGGFKVALGGLRFTRPGDAARLRARLGACTTQHLAIPVSQPAYGPYRSVRWRVVATRANGQAGTTRVYLPARTDRPLDDAPSQGCLDLLRAGRAEEALEGFGEACQLGTAAEQAVLGRWVVLAMLACGRAGDAAEVAAAFAHDFPTQPDYFVLAVLAAVAARRPVDVADTLRCVEMLGVGARYEEWFDDPYALLAHALATRVPAARAAAEARRLPGAQRLAGERATPPRSEEASGTPVGPRSFPSRSSSPGSSSRR